MGSYSNPNPELENAQFGEGKTTGFYRFHRHRDVRWRSQAVDKPCLSATARSADVKIAVKGR